MREFRTHAWPWVSSLAVGAFTLVLYVVVTSCTNLSNTSTNQTTQRIQACVAAHENWIWMPYDKNGNGGWGCLAVVPAPTLSPSKSH